MMDKHYDFSKAEKEILEFWDKSGIFNFDPESKRPTYSIDFPPPYVSGDSLHMGHAANYTHFDIVARFKRMQGYNVFMPLGLDDNGHPTEILAEKIFGISKKTTSREEFIKKCLELINRFEPKYIEQFKKIGHSFNRNVTYQTIGKEAQRVAQISFIELYKKGRIYRAKDVVIWCPRCQTALAQADLEEKTVETKLVYIKFKVKETGQDLIIATTRPELLGAVVAVFVNPEDNRYRDLVGKHAIVPIYEREVPIIADEKVDPGFGTGAVMVATFGDKTDVEWVKTHKLPIIQIIDEEGRLTEAAGPLAGLSIEEARKQIVELLRERGFVTKEEKLVHTVSVCWRCKTPVEFLVKEQWFVKVTDLKDKLIELGRQIRWVPEHFRVRYEQWVQNLKWDWVISRQRYYGVPFPVWYAKKRDGSIEVILPDEKDLPVDPRFQEPPKDKIPEDAVEVYPEEDVMDTWFISSLTPMIASYDWRREEKVFRKIFPMDLRPQSHDIIRTWAFYTIVKAYLHEGTIPWKTIMLSGYVYAPDGRPMSKSLGNIVSIDDIVAKYGGDGVRYWAVGVKLGEDNQVKYQELEKSLDVRRKLWNVARFLDKILSESGIADTQRPQEPKELYELDRVFLAVLADYIQRMTQAYEDFRFETARKLFERMLYTEIGSYYLELIKYRIYGNINKESAIYTAYVAIRDLVKTIAPILVFVTEKIWQELFKDREASISVHVASWPSTEHYLRLLGSKLEEYLETWKILTKWIDLARKAKTEQGISLGKQISKLELTVASSKEFDVLTKFSEDLKNLLRAQQIEITLGKEDRASIIA
jgi:valyl-tRNA synthetase